jgi:hypothetical protein
MVHEQSRLRHVHACKIPQLSRSHASDIAHVARASLAGKSSATPAGVHVGRPPERHQLQGPNRALPEGCDCAHRHGKESVRFGDLRNSTVGDDVSR